MSCKKILLISCLALFSHSIDLSVQAEDKIEKKSDVVKSAQIEKKSDCEVVKSAAESAVLNLYSEMQKFAKKPLSEAEVLEFFKNTFDSQKISKKFCIDGDILPEFVRFFTFLLQQDCIRLLIKNSAISESMKTEENSRRVVVRASVVWCKLSIPFKVSFSKNQNKLKITEIEVLEGVKFVGGMQKVIKNYYAESCDKAENCEKAASCEKANDCAKTQKSKKSKKNQNRTAAKVKKAVDAFVCQKA